MVLAGLLGSCGRSALDREAIDMLFALDPRSAAPRSATPALRELGAQLFAQSLGVAACTQCHVPGTFGQDGSNHGRNTPVLADVARQLVLGWDGAGSSLEGMVATELRVRGGIADDADARRLLTREPGLQVAFEAAFAGESASAARLVQALVLYLDEWRTRGRWDRYVEGDDAALTEAEQHGLAVFVEVGCAACHAGRTLGGRSRHRLGAAVPFATADTGLHAVTGREADRFFFKAPMLRLAACTGPYLHDGSVAELEATVRLMAKHELGVVITPEQTHAIVTFLRAAADTDSAASGGR